MNKSPTTGQCVIGGFQFVPGLQNYRVLLKHLLNRWKSDTPSKMAALLISIYKKQYTVSTVTCCFDAFMCNIPCNTNCQQLVLLPITTTGISNCCTGTKDIGLHQNLDTTVKVEACSFLWRLLNGASSRKSLASWCFFTWIFGTVGPIQHAHRQGCMVGFGRHHLCVKTLTSQGKNVLQNKPFIVCCVCGMLFYQVGIYNWGNAFIINLFKSSSRSTSAHYQVWKPSLSSASPSITFLPSLLKGESKKGSWREGKKKIKNPVYPS